MGGKGQCMNESIWQIIPYLFTLVLSAAVIEIILSVRWSRIYFTTGIPIYRRTIAIGHDQVQLPSPEQIEDALPPRDRRAPMIVRRIGINQLAFREKLFHFGVGYSPVMRGCITYRPLRGEAEVCGYLNWYILTFASSLLLFLLISPFDPANIIIPLCMLVVLTYIYLMQKKRFREVGNAVLKLRDANRQD